VGLGRGALEDLGVTMRVLVTGHRGYLGGVLVPHLRAAGHDVIGLDSGLFDRCTFTHAPDIPALDLDIRDVRPEHFVDLDAVVHLAGISNDPLGDLDADVTFDINHRGAVRVARAAKAAGVTRFVQSSSCSLYGSAGEDLLDESAEFNPVTPYGVSKVLAEDSIRALADDDFHPTFLRNGTAYGVAPHLRIDLVVNNLTGFAVATGEVLLKSNGRALRPLVHVDDISRAFVAVLEAPLDAVSGEAFNVGHTDENYRIRDVATIVEGAVPGSRVRFADEAGPDIRNYRVNCDKLAAAVPAFACTWTVGRGVEELAAAYTAAHLTLDDVVGPRFLRIRYVEGLLARGLLDTDLRWRSTVAAPSLAGGPR
jgi:nucleoside-diphosphate-sugar epimerase